MEEFFGGTMGLFPEGQELIGDLKEQVARGIMDFKSSEGRVRMDLIRGEDGGSLVIDSEDGQVRFDLKKTEDGGFLAIDTDEGQVRFDLVKGDEGGSLVINSEDGQVRFDVRGARMGVPWSSETDDATLRFGAGDEAEAMPGWVEANGRHARRPAEGSTLSPRPKDSWVRWPGRVTVRPGTSSPSTEIGWRVRGSSSRLNTDPSDGGERGELTLGPERGIGPGGVPGGRAGRGRTRTSFWAMGKGSGRTPRLRTPPRVWEELGPTA